jgi:hypothetical protein
MATLPRLVSGLAAGSLVALMVAAWPANPIYAQTSEPAEAGNPTASPGSPGSKAASTSKPDSDAASTTESGHYAIHAALEEYKAAPHSGGGMFDRASESFPAFCRDWERKLHDRELNNLENINWKDENGWKTATYVSYSPIKTCNCKRSTGGVPIGELTYQETELYLAGRTVEEARHTAPKPVGITNTTEIFRWDRTKWDDGR